jgi:D-beta-D-heptose 7-phosphate kinase/D-beta-D-heptose 1-phosphate adenosyltransferase
MVTATERVQRFSGLRAVVLGDAMLDSYLEGVTTRLCSEGPVPVVRKTQDVQAPGGAANTAANVQALGADVQFLGIVGRDPAGTTLRAALQAGAVDDRWLVEDESVATHHKSRILANDQYVVRLDEGDTSHCSPAGQRRLLGNLEAVFPRCDLVVVSDYGYGAISDALLARLRTLRATRPGVLAVDSKQLRRYRRTGPTVITPNQMEAWSAVQPTDRREGALDLAGVEYAGRRLLELTGAEHAAVTLGAGGVLLLSCHGPARHFSARPVPHAADIGAGDSFTAALALALAAGASCEEAVQIGIAVAGIAVTRRRTAVVRQTDLLHHLRLGEGRAASDLEALLARLDSARNAGRTIVFTNGVFDILHAGHIALLHRARQLGDVLVVGVNTDAGTRRLKGERRPINTEADRLALLTALDVVDHAVLFDEDDPSALIRALRPHIHVKGGNYRADALPEAAAVREVGGQIVILPPVEGRSTSAVIGRIRALTPDVAEGVAR